DFWWDYGHRIAKQPSLVVDPKDGRIPPLTDAARERNAQRRALYDNPEERPLAERCILGFNSGPPMVPSAYNNNVQIVQTATRVAIVNEMIHSARLVDVTGRADWAEEIGFLTGDSIGRWDGDTLLIDETTFCEREAALFDRLVLRDGAAVHRTQEVIQQSLPRRGIVEYVADERGLRRLLNEIAKAFRCGVEPLEEERVDRGIARGELRRMQVP